MALVTSHLLNGADGTHAGLIPVRLMNLNSGATLFATMLDTAGRLSETVRVEGKDQGDRFELVFLTGAYWSVRGYSDPRVLDEIVLRFAMPDPDARYHMPIIFSPFSYSCWNSLAER